MKAPPSLSGPGRVGDRPSRSPGRVRGSVGRRPGALRALSATGQAGVPGQRELGQECRLRGAGAGGGRAATRRLLAVCTEAGAAAVPPRSPWTGFIAPGSSRRCRAAGVSPHVGSRPSPAPCTSPLRVQLPRPARNPGDHCLPPCRDVPFRKAGALSAGFKERVPGVGSGPCWELAEQLRARKAESRRRRGVPPSS